MNKYEVVQSLREQDVLVVGIYKGMITDVWDESFRVVWSDGPMTDISSARLTELSGWWVERDGKILNSA